jgi:ADP-ribose pyrophosphatase YjhB (NUDIX family)
VRRALSVGRGRPAFAAQRGLAYLWGALPGEALKTALVWLAGPRFLVNVLAVIVDDQGRVLLLRHTHDCRHPWGLPSGRLERDETPAAGIVRELREETGLQAVVRALVAVEREPRLPVVRIAYRCQIVGGTFRPSVEVSAARYYPLHALPSALRPLQGRIIQQTISASERS